MCKTVRFFLNSFVTVFTYGENGQRLYGLNSIGLPFTLMGGHFTCDCYVGCNSKIVSGGLFLKGVYLAIITFIFATTLKPILISNGLCTERNTYQSMAFVI
jgi:hypothetical protein